MSPLEALTFFGKRFDVFETATIGRLKALEDRSNEQDKSLTIIQKELEMTRKSLDRFTNAVIVGSVSVIAAAMAVIFFGGGG